MARGMKLIGGVVWTIALMMLALGLWDDAPGLSAAAGWLGGVWSFRWASVAAGAGAQLVMVRYVWRSLFDRRTIDQWAGAAAATICSLAAAAAVVSALA
jgi:hypothetical protein